MRRRRPTWRSTASASARPRRSSTTRTRSKITTRSTRRKRPDFSSSACRAGGCSSSFTPSARATRCASSRPERPIKRSGNIMSERDTRKPLVFSVVEDDGENVTIEISEEDYRRDLEAGIAEEDTLKPGRYKMKRGGFLARHPELKIKDRKRA